MKKSAHKDRNRGQHPKDVKLFGPKWMLPIQKAVADHSYLLSKGYGSKSTLELVGNRYRLNKRQRKAVLRMSASDEQVKLRQNKILTDPEVKAQPIIIDGFNLLILLENALSGAYIFECRDGLYRDISSVHGSYKRVLKTEEAIYLAGDMLKRLEVGPVKWLLDSPVSNSGRLKTLLYEKSEEHSYNWEVELAFNPDKLLAESNAVVISSDGWILDAAKWWYNLGRKIIETHVPDANIISATPT